MATPADELIRLAQEAEQEASSLEAQLDRTNYHRKERPAGTWKPSDPAIYNYPFLCAVLRALWASGRSYLEPTLWRIHQLLEHARDLRRQAEAQMEGTRHDH